MDEKEWMREVGEGKRNSVQYSGCVELILPVIVFIKHCFHCAGTTHLKLSRHELFTTGSERETDGRCYNVSQE